MLGRGDLSHFSKDALSSTLSVYITSIAFVLSEYNAALIPMPLVDYYLFYDGEPDMQI